MFHLTSDYLLHKFEIFGVPFQNSGISYGQQSASLVSSESPQTHTLDRKYVITNIYSSSRAVIYDNEAYLIIIKT